MRDESPARRSSSTGGGRRAAIWMHRLRVVEAMGLLTLAGVAQRTVPMRFWSSVLGRPVAPPEAWWGVRVGRLPVRAATRAEARAGRAVRRACQALPWKPTCLAEAAAGQVLLRQLGEPGVVVIGLRPPDPGASSTAPGSTAPAGAPRWDAHAWLMGRQGAITGGPAATGFTATTVYEVPSGLSASEVAAAEIR